MHNKKDIVNIKDGQKMNQNPKFKKVIIGDKLRKALATRPESLNEIARQTGVDVAGIHRFLKGGSLRIESTELLAGFLGFTFTNTKPRAKL